MKFSIKEFNIKSKSKNEIIDVNEQLKKTVAECRIKDGLAIVYTPHATCAIMINENYDPNVCDDILNALNKLIKEGVWKHDRADDNAAAHIKSAIIGPSEIVPIKNGKLMLGQWQSIMLADFDGPRERTVIVQVISS